MSWSRELSKAPPPKLMSEAEIRAVYRQGDDAVVALVQGLLSKIEELSSTVEGLSSRMEALENQQSKNSRNSSKPPSGDGFGQRTQSLRQKSTRSSGGQAGHPGQTLEWRETVDEVVVTPVVRCETCAADLQAEPVQKVYARQVQELPPIQVRVIEHQTEVKTCPHCGHVNQSLFPAAVSNRVQYGSRLKGLMVYLMGGQLLPSQRTCDMIRDLLGISVSEGTLFSVLTECAQELEPFELALQDRLIESPLLHGDETGLRVAKQLGWLHVVCTDKLTAYTIHLKRGVEAMDTMGILPLFTGKLVHDGWLSYDQYPCRHFLCNAHHLRELQFIWERYHQPWAVQMSLLLSTMHQQVKTAKQQGLTTLDSPQLRDFETRYRQVLDQGWAANPEVTCPTEPNVPKPRGRPKQSPSRNLLHRLQNKQAAVLGFLYDFEVPFDNNQAERDIRMVKLKQKISGCFRTIEGAQGFCRIRSFLSTLRKQGLNLLDSLEFLFSGNSLPRHFLPQPE